MNELLGARRFVLVLACVGMLVASCGTRRSTVDIASAAGVPAGASMPTTVNEDQPVASGGTTTGTATDSSETAKPAQVEPASVPPTTAGGARPDEVSGSPGNGCDRSLAPVKIGSVGTQSGVVGATLGDSVRAVQAGVQWLNERGGLACHPVELIVGDDGADPARHRALVQEFVEQRKVIAFVQSTAPLSGQAGIEYLERHRIPFIGSEGGSDWFYESPMYFPQMTSGRRLIDIGLRAPAPLLVAEGKTRLGTLTCSEVQFCTDADRDWNGVVAAEVGLEPAYRARASLAQPSFTSECLNARSNKVQVFAVAMDPNSVTRLARDCAAQGFRPTFVYMLSSSTTRHADDPNLEGAFITIPVQPWFLESPAIEEARQGLARHAPGLDVNATTILGWTAVRLLETAGRELPDDPTSEDLLRGLWAIQGNTLDGLTSPLQFSKDKPAPQVTCGFIVTIHGGFTSPNGGERVCA